VVGHVKMSGEIRNWGLFTHITRKSRFGVFNSGALNTKKQRESKLWTLDKRKPAIWGFCNSGALSRKNKH